MDELATVIAAMVVCVITFVLALVIVPADDSTRTPPVAAAGDAGPPYMGAVPPDPTHGPDQTPTHYVCNCGGRCGGPRGHDLCERFGPATPCFCDQQGDGDE